MTLRMFAALEQAGVPTDLKLLAGEGHMFDGNPQFSAAIVEAMTLFLGRYVAAPATAEAVAADD